MTMLIKHFVSIRTRIRNLWVKTVIVLEPISPINFITQFLLKFTEEFVISSSLVLKKLTLGITILPNFDELDPDRTSLNKPGQSDYNSGSTGDQLQPVQIGTGPEVLVD